MIRQVVQKRDRRLFALSALLVFHQAGEAGEACRAAEGARLARA